MNIKTCIKRLAVLSLCLFMLAGCNARNPKEEEELAFRMEGIEALQSGEYEKAIESFQKALDHSNGRISEVELDICYYKAYSQILAGDNAGAKQTYDALIDYDDENGNAYLLRGNLQLLMGDADAASKDYNEAIRCKKSGYEWYMYAYEQLAGMGYITEGQTYLWMALELDSKTKEDYRQRGRIYIILEDYTKAKEELSKAQNLGDEESKLYMAQALELEGSYEEAKAIYENYAKSHEGDALACERMAKMFMMEERYEDALVYAKQAWEAGNVEDEQSLRRYEIIAHEHLGNYEKARTLLTEYMEKYPLDATAKKELIFLMTR